MHKILRMSDEKRGAVLIAFVKSYETIALDDALDVLDLLISGITAEAKKIGQKRRLRTMKDLDKSALALAGVCRILLDDDIDDIEVRAAIFSQQSKEELQAAIDTVRQLARPPSDNFHDEIVEQYGKVRRFLP